MFLLVSVLTFTPGLWLDGVLIGLIHVNLAVDFLHFIVGSLAACISF